MAGATVDEIVGIVVIQLGSKLQSVVADLMASVVPTDPKTPTDLIRIKVLDALASVASTVVRSPLQSDAFLFCTRANDLGDGSGQYIIDKSEVTGPIVQVDVSYSEDEPFTYVFAETDSPTAIQDFRTLYDAGRRISQLRSYAISPDSIYYPGTRISVVFIPGDIGDDGSDVLEIPRKYGDWTACKVLGFLFPRDGGKLGAGQHYAQQDMRYTAMATAGQAEFPAFIPYTGP